ncbi:GAF domain-containing protein [Microbacterium sp. LMI12-1-1.1]|uniref:GAF domain-containing sensor histidine kinase n=1 Tax=Microbacterium sp. LMI12-1-1.1 TaxID=3135225 RepID=UPI00342456A6
MAEPGSLSFPDGPRAELEDAISALVAQSAKVMRTQGRLRALLRANQAVVEQSDLTLVLRSIVEAAVELVDARYGAMGVISPERDALEQFIYVGLSEEDAAAIGHLPEGRGLLGALITDSRPILLAEMEGDPRAAGFPPHHPPMHSFLGVAVRVGDEVFGNLYLTNHRDGGFSEEDEQLLEALAATAGFAIGNARLLAEAKVRAHWMTAAAELSAAILSTSTTTALDLLVTRVREVSGAEQVTILLPSEDDGRFRVAATNGEAEAVLRATEIDPSTVFAGRVLDDPRPHTQPRRPIDADDPLLIVREGVSGPVMAIPLQNGPLFWGVMCISRGPDDSRFSPAETEGAVDLSSRASIALELARAGEEAQRALLADDRRRIARDLHDHVIQQLFGAGLGLQALASSVGPGPAADGISETIDQLDDAIAQIRTVIFALSHRDDTSVRHRVLDVVGEVSSGARRPPAIRFNGPVDLLVRDELATDVVAVARELLCNAIRHAQADHVSLDVTASDDRVAVVVEDDGGGIPADAALSGLDNLRQRAEQRRGAFVVESSPVGTTVRWIAPTGSASGTSLKESG